MLRERERPSLAQRSSRYCSALACALHNISHISPLAMQMAIEAISTVHATDFKADEVEIGIVSDADEEDPKTRGQWRVMDTAEIEQHLLAYAEKD